MPTTHENPVIAVETFEAFQERLDDVMENTASKGILFSTELNTPPLEEPSGLTRTPITWPIDELNMFYLLEAPPNTEVPRHFHQSDIFRYLIDGELSINGVSVSAGKWFVVKKARPIRYRLKPATNRWWPIRTYAR